MGKNCRYGRYKFPTGAGAADSRGRERGGGHLQIVRELVGRLVIAHVLEGLVGLTPTTSPLRLFVFLVYMFQSNRYRFHFGIVKISVN